FVADVRLARRAEDAGDAHDRLAGLETEDPGHVDGRPQAPALHDATAEFLAAFVVGQQPQEAELGARLVVGRDEGAPPLPSYHQVVASELVDRLAHGALAHAIAAGEFDLAGDRLAGLPFARLQALRQ